MNNVNPLAVGVGFISDSSVNLLKAKRLFTLQVARKSFPEFSKYGEDYAKTTQPWARKIKKKSECLFTHDWKI